MIKSLLLSMLLAAGLPLSAAETNSSSPTPALSANCLLVDGSLTDAEAAQNPFVFNSFKEAMQHLQPGTSAENRMTVLIRRASIGLTTPSIPR